MFRDTGSPALQQQSRFVRKSVYPMQREECENQETSHATSQDHTSIVSSLSGDVSHSDESIENFIRFEKSLPLCGRENERDELLSTLANVTKDHTMRLVVVRGHSGCGKSALVEKSFEDTIAPVKAETSDSHGTNGWFVSGKFDQFSGKNNPFAAICSAITHLIDLLDHHGVTQMYQNDVKAAIRGNEDAFRHMIPNLDAVTCSAAGTAASKPPHAMAFRQFLSTFVSLLNALGHPDYPLVLFLDDMQWMDDGSLELLQAMLTDNSLKHILVVGAIRDDEPCTPTILNCLDQVSSKNNQDVHSVTFVDVGNLDETSVSQMVSIALEMAVEKCQSLSTLVFQKTLGNPFAVLQFLDLIAARHLLVFENNAWVWDEDRIRSTTDVTENVLEMIQSNLQRLRKRLKRLMVLGSFLGYEFQKQTIVEIACSEEVQRLMKQTARASEVQDLLGEACKQGLVERIGKLHEDATVKYKFSHDKVQQALYDSVPEADALVLHRIIGMHLWEGANGRVVAIDAANHLNRAQQMLDSPADKTKLIEANFAAAKSARTRNVYPSAVQFLKQALNLQDSEKWTTDYDRTLAMSTLLLEVCVACGKNEDVDRVVEDVLTYARCFEDKLPIMYGKVTFLGSSGRYQEAVSYATDVVQLTGETFPTQPSAIQIGLVFFKGRRWVSRLEGDRFNQLSDVSDSRAKYLMQLLSRIGLYGEMLGRFALSMYCNLRLVALSKVHGIHPVTPIGLCYLGIVELAMGNFKTACRCGRLALRLARERSLGPESLAGVYAVGIPTFLHWTMCCDQGLATQLSDGMDAGIRAGEYDFGYGCGMMSAALEIFTGVFPLETVEQRARKLCTKLREVRGQGSLYFGLVYWQLCLNLLGNSDQATVLAGEAMDEVLFVEDPVVKEGAFLHVALKSAKFKLAGLFGSDRVAKELASDLKRETRFYLFQVYDVKLHLALTWYKLAKQSTKLLRRRSYLTKARQVVQFMKRMRRKGCPNFKHALLLLEAEDASCSKRLKPDEVKALYDVAIAATSGNLSQEATVFEQAGLFQLGVGDVSSGKFYIEQAAEKYMQWNAYAKVADLEKKLGPFGLLDGVRDVEITTLYLPSNENDEISRADFAEASVGSEMAP